MKKLGLIVLVLVLTLGVLGVGYAAWDHNLTVGATVYTGTAKAEFSNNLYSTNAYNNPATNVCYATAVPDLADPTILDVTVYHAFPGVYVQNLMYYVTNVGDVPITVNSLTLTDGPVTLSGSSIPTDAVIAPTVQTSAQLTFQLSSDPAVITENSTIYFHAALDYGVVVGP
jgi:hypothetical protein